VVGGTDVFALFLSIGYDAFFLTRSLASIPRGRPVFPGVGNGVAVEELFKQYGLVLRDTRMLDPASETVVQEWGPKA
jgi:dihydrofolate reductase